MKKVISYLIISAVAVTFASCKDKQDDMLLLMTGDQRRAPQNVPGNDLQVVPSNTYDGGGQVVAIVGESQSPEDSATPVPTTTTETAATNGSTTTTTETVATNGSTTTTTETAATNGSTTTTTETAATNGSTGTGTSTVSTSDDDDHEHADHDDDDGDREHADHDDDDGDHEHADHDGEGDDDHDGQSLVRHGEDFCFAEGAWYKDSNTIFTYEGKPIGFCFNNLKQGKYEAVVMAKHWFKNGTKNKTVLPGLTEYRVKVAGDGDTKTITIPVNSNSWEQSSSVVDLVGGDTMVMVNWENPYCEANSCANIQLLSIHLKKVGKSDRSAIAAYLLNFSKSNYLMLLTVLVIAVAAIAAINMKQRLSKS
jgi:hypothetical protein